MGSGRERQAARFAEHFTNLVNAEPFTGASGQLAEEETRSPEESADESADSRSSFNSTPVQPLWNSIWPGLPNPALHGLATVAARYETGAAVDSGRAASLRTDGLLAGGNFLSGGLWSPQIVAPLGPASGLALGGPWSSASSSAGTLPGAKDGEADVAAPPFAASLAFGADLRLPAGWAPAAAEVTEPGEGAPFLPVARSDSPEPNRSPQDAESILPQREGFALNSNEWEAIRGRGDGSSAPETSGLTAPASGALVTTLPAPQFQDITRAPHEPRRESTDGIQRSVPSGLANGLPAFQGQLEGLHDGQAAAQLATLAGQPNPGKAFAEGPVSFMARVLPAAGATLADAVTEPLNAGRPASDSPASGPQRNRIEPLAPLAEGSGPAASPRPGSRDAGPGEEQHRSPERDDSTNAALPQRRAPEASPSGWMTSGPVADSIGPPHREPTTAVPPLLRPQVTPDVPLERLVAPPKELTLTIPANAQGEGVLASVHVRDQNGAVEIAVRTPDARLSSSLQDGLPDLVTRLEAHGSEATVTRGDAWRANPSVATGASDRRDAPGNQDGGQNSRDARGQHSPGGQTGGQTGGQSRGQSGGQPREPRRERQVRWQASLGTASIP